jgi:hypothetical protein
MIERVREEWELCPRHVKALAILLLVASPISFILLVLGHGLWAFGLMGAVWFIAAGMNAGRRGP